MLLMVNLKHFVVIHSKNFNLSFHWYTEWQVWQLWMKHLKKSVVFLKPENTTDKLKTLKIQLSGNFKLRPVMKLAECKILIRRRWMLFHAPPLLQISGSKSVGWDPPVGQDLNLAAHQWVLERSDQLVAFGHQVKIRY